MPSTSFPHERLVAYQVASELMELVHSIAISHAKFREQARSSACSAALNAAEGAARRSQADKSRVFSLAHAEVCECVSAVQLAGRIRACRGDDVARVEALGRRAKDLLSRLVK
jgi:four helix bundle protein